MDSRVILSFLLVLFFATACTKDSDSIGNDGPSSVVEYSLPACNHQSLVHHPGLAPTYTEFGSAEYWECKECGAVFCDERAEVPFTGYRYILPTKFVNIQIDNPFHLSGDKARTKTVVEDVAILVSVASLLASITGLIVTVASYNNDNSDLVEEINKLSEKSDKTADDLSSLSTMMSDLSSQVSVVCDSLNKLYFKLDEMDAKLSTVQSSLDAAQNSIDRALKSIATVEQDIQIQDLLDDRINSLMLLRTPTLGAWEALKEYFKEDYAAIGSAQSVLDSLEAQSVFTSHINQLVSSWALEQQNCPALTLELLQSSQGMDYGGLSKYTDLLDKYSADHFVWNFQGLAFKELLLEFDDILMMQSYSLAKIYFELRTDMDAKYKARRIAELESLYNSYTTDVNTFLTGLQSQYEGDIVCNATGKTFDRNLGEYIPSFYSSIESDLIQYDYCSLDDKNVIKEKLSPIFNNLKQTMTQDVTGLTEGFDLRDWELMYSSCYAENKSNKDVLLSSDFGGMGFNFAGTLDGELYVITSGYDWFEVSYADFSDYDFCYYLIAYAYSLGEQCKFEYIACRYYWYPDFSSWLPNYFIYYCPLYYCKVKSTE